MNLGTTADAGTLIALIVPPVALTALTFEVVLRANRRMNARLAERDATGVDPREARTTIEVLVDADGAVAAAGSVLNGLKLKYGTSVHAESGQALRCALAADWRSWGEEVLVEVFPSEGRTTVVIRCWPSSDWARTDWGRSREVVDSVADRVHDLVTAAKRG